MDAVKTVAHDMPSPLSNAEAGIEAIDRATHPACTAIDTHGRAMLTHGGSDEAIRMAMVDKMGPCKPWLETGTDADMDTLCEHYNGLYLFATLLEQVTKGIAKGRLPVPACRATYA